MRVLIVCAGNTCRSPMAGGLLRQLAVERRRRIDVRTAGVAAQVGQPVAAQAVEVMNEVGIDISDEYSKEVSAADVEWADAIVALDSSHADYLADDHPNAMSKIIVLPERVPDPHGQSLVVYRARRDQLARLVRDIPLWESVGTPYTASGRRHRATSTLK